MYAPNEELTQCYNVFKTRCTVNGKVCDVIIDSKSSENIVSSTMVQKQGLKIERHPHLYKIGWIKKDSETNVTKTSLIKFSMENVYFHEIYRDVVDTDACHMILHRRW